MHIFNRTLNIMVMLSAVIICVLAYRLHDRRLELRDRGDLFARKIHEAASKADENSPTTIADQLECRTQGEGGLGWRAHRENREKVVRSLRAFVEAIERTRKQRDELGVSIAAIARRLEVDSVQSKDLNDPSKSERELAKVSQALHDFIARDQTLREDLVKAHALVNPRSATDALALKDIKNCRNASNDVVGEIERMQLHLGRHQAAMIKLTQAIGSTYFPGMKAADFENLKPETVQSLLSAGRTVNERLAERELLREQVVLIKGKLQKSLELLDDANTSLAKRAAKIRTLDEKVGHLEAKIRTMVDPTGVVHGDNPPQYDGRVVKVNYDFNYMIISYEQKKDQIHPGLMLTVARDREYICRARISRLYRNYAVAEIPVTDGVGTVMEGDRVVLLD